MDYSFSADFMNKFSQLTPWVQAVVAISACATMVAIAHCLKQTLVFIVGHLTAAAQLRRERLRG